MDTSNGDSHTKANQGLAGTIDFPFVVWSICKFCATYAVYLRKKHCMIASSLSCNDLRKMSQYFDIKKNYKPSG